LNRSLPEPARVRRYLLLHKEFDPDEAEMTRTRKLRRSFVEQKYAPLIAAIYGDANEFVTESDVKYRDGRTAMVKTAIQIRTMP
jgi:long-chain acyl-CoA synthetase